MSAAQVLAVLRENGFSEVRRRGSHIAMQLRLPQSTVTVVVPDHRQIKIGTLNSIIRQSGLDRRLFKEP